MTLSLEMKAPVILLPESATEQKGCVLLDMGHLVMQMEIDEVGLDLDIDLTDIRAGMPPTNSFMRDYARFEEPSVELL